MDRNIACRRTAQKCVREGDVDRAIEAYEEVVSSGDADPYDYVYAGDLYAKTDLTEEAIARFRQGVAAYGRLGFNRNAIALCRRILGLDAKQLDVLRELGDLLASEELLDEALEAYLGYLERVDPQVREEEAFRETLTRAEELAARRPVHAVRLAELLESLGHTEASADLLSRTADVARSAGEAEVAGELMERALGLNPALAKSAEMADSIEDRLQQVHRSKMQAPGSAAAAEREPHAEEAAQTARARQEARDQTPSVPSAAAQPVSAGEPYEIDVPEAPAGEADRSGEEEADEGLALPGFQEVDFTSESDESGSSELAIERLDSIERGRRGATSAPGETPKVDRVEIQGSAHPAAAAGTPPESAPSAGRSVEAPSGADRSWEGDSENQLASSEPGSGAPDAEPLSFAQPAPSESLTDPDVAEEADPAEAAREAMAAQDWKLARRWVEAWLLQDPTSHEAADAMIQTCEAQQDRAGTIEGLTLKGDLLIQGQELPAAVPLFWRVLEMDPENDTALRRMARFRELGLVAADAMPGEPGEEKRGGAAASDAAAEGDAAGEGGEQRREERSGTAPRPQEREMPLDPARALAVLSALRGDGKPPVDPPETETHYARGLVHLEMGHLDDALEAFDAALAESDTESERSRKLHELRAKCLSGKGEHRAAIAELEPVAEALDPSDREAAPLHYFLALEHETLGELDAARERLRMVMAARPDFAQAGRRLAQLEERAA
ncbi:MAG: hypothetical protein GF330_14435 [Candidatus Eisenbacteria bacterium]|nr:hypothetical protein [Candidatus Eisenbacteria bacterium]